MWKCNRWEHWNDIDIQEKRVVLQLSLSWPITRVTTVCPSTGDISSIETHYHNMPVQLPNTQKKFKWYVSLYKANYLLCIQYCFICVHSVSTQHVMTNISYCAITGSPSTKLICTCNRWLSSQRHQRVSGCIIAGLVACAFFEWLIKGVIQVTPKVVSCLLTIWSTHKGGWCGWLTVS